MKQQKGFTLIELLVVIAIIALLSSVVLASLSTARAKSRDARRISDINQFQRALELYFDTNAKYPTTTTADGSNRVRSHEPTLGWNILENELKSYIPKLPIDPINTGSFYYAYDPTPVDANAGCSTTSLYTIYFSTETTIYPHLTYRTPTPAGVARAYCVF
ncbi:MAG TPA: type II secretion system protein [Candidatus Paceibacterota bacterium]|nr:type II secretion system protein [Candidatus Paceibacterota bacterium]